MLGCFLWLVFFLGAWTQIESESELIQILSGCRLFHTFMLQFVSALLCLDCGHQWTVGHIKPPSAWVWRASDGATALHVAVSRRHRRLVELLLANTADPAAVDGQGWTPLLVAAHHKQTHTDVSHLAFPMGNHHAQESFRVSPW